MNPWKLSDPVYESHRNTFLLSVVDNLKDLTHLNFSGIGLNEIPKVIENFIGLKVVDLSNNEISEIDGAIFNQVIFSNQLCSTNIYDCGLKGSGFKIFLIILSWSRHGTIVGYLGR